MPTAPVASVVIPVRDGETTLAAQLQALVAQREAPRFEVIVVDDGSRDGTVAVAASFQDHLDLSVVSLATSGGVERARAIGVMHARSDLLLFCDADDVVAPSWVRGLVDGLAAHDLVTGLIDRELLNTEWMRAAHPPAPLDSPPQSFHLPFAYGGNLGVRRSTLAAVGGWEGEPPGGDDVGLSWRIQLAGISLGFAPDAVVHHRLRPTIRGLVRQQVGYAVRDQLLRVRYGPFPAPWRQLRLHLWLLRHLPWSFARDRSKRARWCYELSWAMGRAIGGLRYRVWPF